MNFSNMEVFNFQGAIRGMRNPLNSHDKSDSIYTPEGAIALFGKADMKLAQKLILADSDHSKFLRQIMVSVDICAPLYWWKEFDTYKVGTVANSTSTMHKLAHTPITLDCFEFGSVKELYSFTTMTIAECLVNLCENYRQEYLRTKDINIWKALIQILPSGWLQTRTVTLNYQVLRNMYFSRKNHKLSEWSIDFTDWVSELPYGECLITFAKMDGVEI